MKARTLLLSGLALFGLLAIPSSALSESITVTSGTVTAADPVQNGRLVRNGIPQDWLGSETFPGENNPGVAYHYLDYKFDANLFSGGPFVAVTFDDPDAVYFISAYSGAYDPSFGGKGTNWLGDEGSTGNYYFGGPTAPDPSFFQVILPFGDDLHIIINDTVPGGGGLGAPFTFTVDNFANTNYDSPVPEPSSLVLLGTGLIGAVTAVRRRLR